MKVYDVAILLALCGCNGPKEPAPLVSATGWSRVDLAEDPYADRYPGEGACPETAFQVEEIGGEMSLGVDGQNCAFLTVRQPTLAEIEEGDLIFLRLWHYELSGLKASTATLTLSIDGQAVLERHIPVPSDSELITTYLDAPFEAPAGAPVIFHVENHGTNSYNLIELRRGGVRPEAAN